MAATRRLSVSKSSRRAEELQQFRMMSLDLAFFLKARSRETDVLQSELSALRSHEPGQIAKGRLLSVEDAFPFYLYFHLDTGKEAGDDWLCHVIFSPRPALPPP